MKRNLPALLWLLLIGSVLALGSCSRTERKHTFIKLYTSSNVLGELEPCG